MYYLFVILIVIASLLMIGIVLIQESKGGGLSSQFGAGNQFAGVRKTTDFIEKATWGLAIAMVVLSVFCAYVAPTVKEQNVIEATDTNPLTNPATQQNFGASPAKDAAAPAAAKEAPAAAKDAPAAAPAKDAAAPAAAPAKEAPAAPAK